LNFPSLPRIPTPKGGVTTTLRIKPLVMKRQWRGLSIKRNNNYDKVQHMEALLSLIPFDEGDVVQPCLPPNIEDTIILDDE
jgi:hypothetical protein